MTSPCRARDYFEIQQADGTDAYTRSGNFSLSPQGQLVTQDGLLVLPGIAVPTNATSVTINSQGQVYATVPGNATPQTVGQLELTVFPNEAGLNAIGSNLFLQTPASGSPQAGVPGSHRLRHHPAGLSGNLQRQFGGRDHRPDHGAARL